MYITNYSGQVFSYMVLFNLHDNVLEYIPALQAKSVFIWQCKMPLMVPHK